MKKYVLIQTISSWKRKSSNVTRLRDGNGFNDKLFENIETTRNVPPENE